MDLTYTAEEEAFRTSVRSWLSSHVRPMPSVDTREGFEAHRAWERELAAAGFDTGDVVRRAIFEEEYFLAGAPERITVVGQKLMAPTLQAHGTEEQKERWLPGIANADDIWSVIQVDACRRVQSRLLPIQRPVSISRPRSALASAAGPLSGVATSKADATDCLSPPGGPPCRKGVAMDGPSRTARTQ